jgi:hypothetical protein
VVHTPAVPARQAAPFRQLPTIEVQSGMGMGGVLKLVLGITPKPRIDG